jgi:transcriptional regulator with XRE-family HTH domain
MSTIILGNTHKIVGDRYNRLFDVNTSQLPQEDLADYVRRIRSLKGLSQNDVERGSRSGGLDGISSAYIGQIEVRQVLGDSLTAKKLSALARGLHVSEDEIFDVARGKPKKGMTKDGFFDALDQLGISEFRAYSGELSPDEMEEIIESLRAQVGVKVKRKQKK